jgi:ketosteroid isomerase-like protein
LPAGNVEIVRRAYVAFEQGDAETLRSLAAPDFVLHASPATDDKVHYGPEAMFEVYQAVHERWEDFRLEPLEFYDAGNRVLVLGTLVTRSRDGEGLTSTVGQVWTLDQGKVVLMEAFLDSGEAIRAAGLDRLLT